MTTQMIVRINPELKNKVNNLAKAEGKSITGGKSLIEIQDYMAIKIVSPKDFLSSYRRFKR